MLGRVLLLFVHFACGVLDSLWDIASAAGSHERSEIVQTAGYIFTITM